MSTSTWITPGTWTALAGVEVWVLADTTSRPQPVRELWATVSNATDADAVLGQFLAKGLADLPGFAIVAADGDNLRLIVRHPAAVRLDSEDGSEDIAPSTGITWVDTTRPRPAQVLLTSGSETRSDNELPLTLGASAADALLVDFDGTAAPVAAHAGPAVPAAAASPSIVAASIEVSTPEPEAVEPVAVIPELPVPEPDLEPPASESESDAPEGDEPAESNPYLGLLTSSTADRDALLERLSKPEESEVPDVVEPVVEPPVGDLTAQWRPEEAPEAPAAPEAPVQEAPAVSAPARGGLIDGVPGMGGVPSAPLPAVVPTGSVPFPAPSIPSSPFAAAPAATPDPSATLVPPAEESDESNNRTMTRGQLQQMLGTAGIVGPSVLAVQCAQGHLSNPMLPRCRTCGGPVPDQTPTQVARPSLGVLRMPNGDTVSLDKSVVLGRAPQPTPGMDEHLVTVTTSGEISRMHARITLDGWNVVLRDLNTTNGTFLTLPGQSIVQLRGGEDYLVEPGSEIDLADTLTLRFEAH